MNQILVSQKLYVTPDMKRKKKVFKFEFFLSVFLLCALSSYAIYAEYDRNKSEEVSKEISDVRINPKNLAQGLVVNAAREEDIMIPVIVKGVESVINEIDSSSINAYIDLSDYTEGTHEVEVHVEGNDVRVNYSPKTTKVKIIISKP